ncbi:MAG TPA: hypothetical protein VGB37_02820 [Candidatus Lokiarchaeia archaeon]
MKIKRIFTYIIIFISSFCFIALPAEAGKKKSYRSSSRSSYSSSSKKTVKVRSYHRKNGTYVKSHYRKRPQNR